MSAHDACAVSAETPTTAITESLRSMVMVPTGGFPPVQSEGNVTLSPAGAPVVLTKDEKPWVNLEGRSYDVSQPRADLRSRHTDRQHPLQSWRPRLGRQLRLIADR